MVVWCAKYVRAIFFFHKLGLFFLTTSFSVYTDFLFFSVIFFFRWCASSLVYFNLFSIAVGLKIIIRKIKCS